MNLKFQYSTMVLFHDIPMYDSIHPILILHYYL